MRFSPNYCQFLSNYEYYPISSLKFFVAPLKCKHFMLIQLQKYCPSFASRYSNSETRPTTSNILRFIDYHHPHTHNLLLKWYRTLYITSFVWPSGKLVGFARVFLGCTSVCVKATEIHVSWPSWVSELAHEFFLKIWLGWSWDDDQPAIHINLYYVMEWDFFKEN